MTKTVQFLGKSDLAQVVKYIFPNIAVFYAFAHLTYEKIPNKYTKIW